MSLANMLDTTAPDRFQKVTALHDFLPAAGPTSRAD